MKARDMEELKLLPVGEKDRAALIALLINEEITKTYMVPPLDSEDKRGAVFERFLVLSRDKSRFVFGIFTGSRLIGMIHDVDTDGGAIELGYFIDPAFKGRGIASWALRTAIPLLFERGFSAVRAGAFRENTASIRVMQKCGMTATGETEMLTYRGEARECVYYEIRK